MSLRSYLDGSPSRISEVFREPGEGDDLSVTVYTLLHENPERVGAYEPDREKPHRAWFQADDWSYDADLTEVWMYGTGVNTPPRGGLASLLRSHDPGVSVRSLDDGMPRTDGEMEAFLDDIYTEISGEGPDVTVTTEPSAETRERIERHREERAGALSPRDFVPLSGTHGYYLEQKHRVVDRMIRTPGDIVDGESRAALSDLAQAQGRWAMGSNTAGMLLAVGGAATVLLGAAEGNDALIQTGVQGAKITVPNDLVGYGGIASGGAVLSYGPLAVGRHVANRLSEDRYRGTSTERENE